MTAPEWLEDPELAAAVAEIEQFAAAAGWNAAPQLFALVPTAELIAAGLAVPDPDGGAYTAIAQDGLEIPTDTDGEPDLSTALAHIAWPPEVSGAVLVQEIVVLPPGAARTADEAAAHPDRREARLVAGVLREAAGGACLLRLRPLPGAEPEPVLRGADLAPNLLAALRATFLD